MTGCERVIALLGDHVSGELSPLVRADVDQHLSACPTCSTALVEYRAVVRLAASLPPSTPSPAAEARLLAALRAATALPDGGTMDETQLEIALPASDPSG